MFHWHRRLELQDALQEAYMSLLKLMRVANSSEEVGPAEGDTLILSASGLETDLPWVSSRV